MPGAPWTGSLKYANRQGSLAINSVPMLGPAWAVLNLLELWIFETTRGENQIVPGTTGQLPTPLRIDQSHYVLEMLITGSVDRNGNPNLDIWGQLQANIDYLKANVATPPSSPTTTRSSTLTMPSGATRTANVQVGRLALGSLDSSSSIIRATLNLIVPAGQYA